MQTEQDRLEKLYGELGDEHLRDLAAEPENLTDQARFALSQEMRRRGFSSAAPPDQPIVATVEPELESGFGPGIPGMFPSSAAMMEQALDTAQPSKDGLSSLVSFYDGIELSKACAILEDAEMEHVIEPIDGDAMSGVPPRFEVWLDSRDIDEAKALLRAKMGLFPLAEVDEEEDIDSVATGLVGVFETQAEADAVMTTLADAGFAATVEQEDEYGEWEVMVAPEEQEKAVAAVASRMGLA